MTERGRFEEWAEPFSDGLVPLDRKDDTYKDLLTHFAWLAWQASRSAAIQECAEVADAYAKQMFGEKVDAEDLAVEIASAIRKLKE